MWCCMKMSHHSRITTIFIKRLLCELEVRTGSRYIWKVESWLRPYKVFNQEVELIHDLEPIEVSDSGLCLRIVHAI